MTDPDNRPPISPALATQTTDFIWIEAEQHARCNFEHFEVSDMGKPDLLSAGKWLLKGIGPDDIGRLVPEQGISLEYAIDVVAEANYELWARVGYFGSRADFRWRIADGQWHEFSKTEPTTMTLVDK